MVEGIAGGYDPRKNQFKYTVSLQADGIHIGGGAVLDSMHVVTAARFFIDVGQNFLPSPQYTIVGGVLNTVEKDRNKIVAKVASVFIPKPYRKFKDETYLSQQNLHEAWSHDLAILKLESPLTLGSSSPIDAVDLPSGSSEGKDFVVSGFGYTSRQLATLHAGAIFDWTERSDIGPCKNCYQMKYTYATKIPNDECSRMLQSNTITNSQICAQTEQKSYDDSIEGLCKGDVGNPLVLRRTNVIVGVHALGRKDCVEKNKAGIYTKIVDNLAFIRSVLDNVINSNFIRSAHYVIKKRPMSKSKRELKEDK